MAKTAIIDDSDYTGLWDKIKPEFGKLSPEYKMHELDENENLDSLFDVHELENGLTVHVFRREPFIG